MKKDITGLFVFVDDFYQYVEKELQNQLIQSEYAKRKPTRICELTIPEMITIIMLYHQSPCKHFKFFYKSYLQLYKSEFPRLISYNRFVELKSRALPYMLLLIQWFTYQTQKTGIAYIDSSSLAVCHFKRIKSHRVFKDFAELGKSTKGWFLGFKLHLVINEKGQLHGIEITPGNVDDRVPVPKLTKDLIGLLLADRGYIKQPLFAELYNRGLKLVTNLRRNMKNKLMHLNEKILLIKRGVIESGLNVLKNTFDLEHTRHRSVPNAFTHIISSLLAYCFKSNKPAIKLNHLIPN